MKIPIVFFIACAFLISAFAPLALAADATPSSCTIEGKTYNEYDFDPSTNKCRLCLPSVSTTRWSTTDNSCLCLCGVRKSAIPTECVNEIYYHGGNAWPSPNVEDASVGGCGRNWCTGSQLGKMCCITNAFSESGNYCVTPQDKRISIVPDPSEIICKFANPVHAGVPACPLPLPGEAGGTPTTSPADSCVGKKPRDSCGEQKWCCKSQCVSSTLACPATFYGYGTFLMQTGDHVEIEDYDFFLADVASSKDRAALNVSKSGSVIEGFKPLKVGEKEIQLFVAKVKLLSITTDAQNAFNAEISFAQSNGRATTTPTGSPYPTYSANPTPSPSPTPAPSLPPKPTPAPGSQIPAGCEVFSACGGAPPQQCVEKGASIAAFSCREAASGKKWKCRQKWESSTALLFCPPCPPGFSLDKCDGLIDKKSFCSKDYESECSATMGCGSDETLSEIAPCDYVASGLKYCCKTPPGMLAPSATPTPMPWPPEGQTLLSPVPPANANASNASRKEKGLVEQLARAVLGPPPLVNITKFTNFPLGIQIPIFEGRPLPVLESADNGAFVEVSSAYKLVEKMNCSGPSDCECSYLSKPGAEVTNFQCVFHPPVNGSYELLAWDVNGNDNLEYVHSVKLVPGEYASLVEELEKEKINLIVSLLGLLLLFALLALAYFAYRKISARFLRLQRLNKKKEHVEQEMKMLKYRFMRRELSDSSYQKLQDVLEKEFNQIKVDIADEISRQNKRKKWF